MFLKNFDFLSNPLTLYYNQYHSHKSIISGIITILTYSLCLILSLYLSQDFIFKKNPTAFTYNRIINDAGIFLIGNENLFHFIDFKTYNDFTENIYEIFGFQDTFSSTYISNPNRENYDHYIYKPCKNLNYNYKSINLNDENTIESFEKGYCISKFYNKTTQKIISISDKHFIPPNLSHGISNPNGTYYGIFIQKCINSTLNNFSCKSKEEIDNYLKETSGPELVILNAEIDVLSYKKPFVYSYYGITSSFSSTGFTINNINLQPLIMKSHEGYIFNSDKEKISYVFEQNSKSNVVSDGYIKSSFYFWMQNKAIIYERQYKKIANVFAEFGGIIKMIVVFGSWINYFFSRFSTLRDVNLIIRKYIDLNQHFKTQSKISFLNTHIRNNLLNHSNNHEINSINKKNDISSLNCINLNEQTFHKNKITNINNSSLQLNSNIIIKYKQNNDINRKNKGNNNLIPTLSKINFKINKNEFTGKVIIKFRYFFCYFCHCSSKNKSNHSFYIYLIEKYYQKIISEEEMFYLAYEVKQFHYYINNSNKNSFNYSNVLDKDNKNELIDKENSIKENEIIREFSSVFKLN